MPALGRAALEALVAHRDPERGATAWQSPDDGLPEPLCAIWEPVTLARLAAVARQAGNSPVSPRAILAAADPLLLNPAWPLALHSVNTPADLRRYLESNDGHKP
jgi:molybdopterin-guanine dinucleotide biosynthesis protein A